jgi:oxygen-independent coproporphyrinogen-3 oxidase
MTTTPTAERGPASTAHDVSFELLQKYDRPGPRYTSYPTAPEWQDAGQDVAIAQYERMADDLRPVSIYVHVPFCERMCLFCGCNVIVAKSHEKIPRYLDCIKREINEVRALTGPKTVCQLHFGGGTPTFLTPDELEMIGQSIWSAFDRAEEAEIGIEVDPMVTTRAHLEAARAVGFNRLSMGVQDFQDDVQQVTDRKQPDARSAGIFEFGRELGFESINVDLMYGLPAQTPDHLAHSARRCVDLGADRVAVFGYAHVPWMKPHQKKLEPFGIPGAEQRWQMFNAARSTLLDAGYKAIGMDHFAKPTDELALAAGKRRLNRNFQGYTVLEPTSLIGLGVSSISDAADGFLQNAKRLSSYYSAIEAGAFATEKAKVLDAEDKLRRDVIIEIMCNLYVDYAAIGKRHGIDFAKHFAAEIDGVARFVEDGLVVMQDGSFEVTERGRVFLRNIAMTFDAYLGKKQEGDSPRFSRTV